MLRRQVELVVRDDRAQVTQRVAIARELPGEGNNFILGGGSTVAVALASVALELNMIYATNSATATAFTHEGFNRNVFRLNPNGWSLYSVSGRAVAERFPQVLRWGAILPDYSAGHDNARAFLRAVQKYHPKSASKDFALLKPVAVGMAQTDFRPRSTRC